MKKIDESFVLPGRETTVLPDTPPLTDIRRTTQNIPGIPEKLKPWQQDLINRINIGNNNIVINISPSGGKTTPVLSAWLDLVSNIRNPKDLPKMLFITPRRQLASQMYTDIREQIIKMLSGKSDDFGRNRNFPNFLIPQGLDFTSDYTTSAQANHMNEFVNNIIAIHTGSGTATGFGNTKFTNNSIALVATYDIASRYLSKYKDFRIVVVDEMQDYFNEPVTLDSGLRTERTVDKEKIHSFAEILIKAPRSCSLILMTGSTNASTTNSIVEILKKLTGKRTELIMFYVPNRSFIKVIPYDHLRTSENIIDLAVKIIEQKQKNSSIIMFSIGGYNESISKNAIIPITQRVRERTIRRTVEQTVGKSIDIPTPTVKTINALTKKDPNYQLNDMLQGYSEINNKRYLRDKDLAECILHGFGYIMTGKKRIEELGHEIENMDTGFIQNLFMNGDIYLIFATDAVGVGANLKIKHMYLSSLNKPLSSGGFGSIDDSSLTQLVHRVGRNPQYIGNIYTDTSYVPRVVKYINSDPSKEIASVDLEELKSSVDRNKLISMLFKLVGRS